MRPIILALLALLGLVALPAAAQEAAPAENRPPQRAYLDPFSFGTGQNRWYVTAYAGLLADNKLSSIARLDADLQNDPFVAVGIGREWGALASWLRLEWEANIASRFEPGLTIFDARFMVGVRSTWFPWNRWLPTTFAVLTGPSYLSAQSWEYEERKGKTSRFQNGMALEFTFAAPSWEQWRGVFRIQHRSPVFGFSGTASPSDAVTLGFQYRF